ERLGYDDPDRSAVAERPGDERREGRADADLALRSRRAARQVERDMDLRALLVEERAAEANLDGRIAVGRRRRDMEARSARRRPDRPRLGLDPDPERVVEVAGDHPAGHAVGLVVPGGDVDRGADDVPVRDE